MTGDQGLLIESLLSRGEVRESLTLLEARESFVGEGGKLPCPFLPSIPRPWSPSTESRDITTAGTFLEVSAPKLLVRERKVCFSLAPSATVSFEVRLLELVLSLRFSSGVSSITVLEGISTSSPASMSQGAFDNFRVFGPVNKNGYQTIIRRLRKISGLT